MGQAIKSVSQIKPVKIFRVSGGAWSGGQHICFRRERSAVQAQAKDKIFIQFSFFSKRKIMPAIEGSLNRLEIIDGYDEENFKGMRLRDSRKESQVRLERD